MSSTMLNVSCLVSERATLCIGIVLYYIVITTTHTHIHTHKDLCVFRHVQSEVPIFKIKYIF